MNTDHEHAVASRNAEYATKREITILEYLQAPYPKPPVEALITWNLAYPGGVINIFDMLLKLMNDSASLSEIEVSKLLDFARRFLNDQRISTNDDLLAYRSTLSDLIEQFV